jgi:hypothetical protein
MAMWKQLRTAANKPPTPAKRGRKRKYLHPTIDRAASNPSPQSNKPQLSYRQGIKNYSKTTNTTQDTARQNHSIALAHNKRITSNNLFFLIPSATRNPA